MDDIITNERILDSVMGCDCDAEIKVMDSYLYHLVSFNSFSIVLFDSGFGEI